MASNENTLENVVSATRIPFKSKYSVRGAIHSFCSPSSATLIPDSSRGSRKFAKH